MPGDDSSGIKRLDFLVGRWTGQGESFGNISEVEHTYQFILQGYFLHSQTKSITRDLDGGILEVHEDWGIFSYDPDRDVIILRGFYSEGYVNIYVLDEIDEATKMYAFTSERTQGAGGMRARLRLQMHSPDRYEMALDLARPGGEFRECQSVRMRRVA